MNTHNGDKTGSPPGMLQDDCRELSKWLSAKPNAKQEARGACDGISTSMHRVSITPNYVARSGGWFRFAGDDLPEDCAPEGAACCRDDQQGRGPDCPQHPRTEPPPALGRAYWVACAIAVASAAWLIGVNVVAGLK